MLNKQKSKGFTIIEVLIVLAIAGLIMLVVFLAVPALRRNAANSGRKNDAAKISSTMTDCLSNRNGVLDACNTPAEVDISGLSQLDATKNAANTAWTNISVSTQAAPTALAAPSPDEDAIKAQITFYAKCNTEGTAAAVSTNKRDFVVLYNLKTSGGVETQCIGS